MKNRHGLFLFILATLLMIAGTANCWPIKSDEKLQKAKKIVTQNVMALAEDDHYFDPSFVNTYVNGLIHSINKNNGQGAIIAHDAGKWCKLIFTLDDDENIREVKIIRYQKDFGEIFKEYKIDQSELLDVIRQFNTSGYAITTTLDGNLVKFSYDFEKNSFVRTVTYQTR
ncbi:MAG: hypothetical protein ABSD50_09690 [Smithella sp.]